MSSPTDALLGECENWLRDQTRSGRLHPARAEAIRVRARSEGPRWLAAFILVVETEHLRLGQDGQIKTKSLSKQANRAPGELAGLDEDQLLVAVKLVNGWGLTLGELISTVPLLGDVSAIPDSWIEAYLDSQDDESASGDEQDVPEPET